MVLGKMMDGVWTGKENWVCDVIGRRNGGLGLHSLTLESHTAFS